jgi:hypothetical protein
MYAISIKMGLGMLLGFILFFLLMYVTGLGYHIELLFFYPVIQILCIYRAIRAYSAIHPNSSANYLWGVAEGMVTSAIGIIGFAIFISIIFTFSPSLMQEMRIDSVLGSSLNPYTTGLIIITEGFVVSLIGSYVATRISEVEPIQKKISSDKS